MELKDLLVTTKPRENSGSRSSNRFDFQQDWVITKLIELHQDNKDYLIVLDYHDDVVVLDSEENPEKMSFYQLKTKNPGTWTLNSLIKAKKGKNGNLPSIMGKLYNCKMSFPNHTLSLNFVSNALFDIKLENKQQKSTDKKEICFSEVCTDQTMEVIQKLKIEHDLSEEPDFIDITFLQVTDLNINDREAYVKGKLIDFLEELNPNGKFRVGLIYRAIFDEIKRRNNYEYNIDSFDDLIKYKSIGKTFFSSILQNFDLDNRSEELWDFTQQWLAKENIPFSEVFHLKNAWRKFEIDRMNLANNYLQQTRDIVRGIVAPYKSSTISLLNEELLAPCYQKFIQSQSERIYTQYYIKAIILMEYYGL